MRAEFPLPDLDEPLTGPFWRHAQESVLAMPRQADGSWHWYPKTTEVEWVPVSGRGTVFSWTEVHQVFLPAFAEQVPFLTGLVALDEDPALRLATRFVDCDSIEIGQAVEVVFRPLRFPTVDGEVLAPCFRPS
jgi:uncharacterized OB-fold protein